VGYLLFNHGRTEEAVSQYDAFLTLDTSPINRLLTAGGTVDATKSLVLTSFFLDDQGQNNADVMRRPGRICRGSDVMAKRTGTESGNVFGKLQPRSDGRLRTGFLSAYFRDHTIERLNLVLHPSCIEGCSRSRETSGPNSYESGYPSFHNGPSTRVS